MIKNHIRDIKQLILVQKRGRKHGCKNNTKLETPKKSVQEIAHEVYLGKWGNYPERKTRLNNAGYNYEEVQAIVNKLVGSSTTNTSKYYKIPSLV